MFESLWSRGSMTHRIKRDHREFERCRAIKMDWGFSVTPANMSLGLSRDVDANIQTNPGGSECDRENQKINSCILVRSSKLINMLFQDERYF